MRRLKLFVSAFIGIVALIGDYLCEVTVLQNSAWSVALCDNVTHAMIGIVTWGGVILGCAGYTSTRFALEVISCGMFSSLIDIDHFIEAKSFSLKDATSIKSRPFLHCTSTVVIILIIILRFGDALSLTWLIKLSWILLTAFVSHHIRDSTRRGFWLWPYGHTSPIPYTVYILLEMSLPFLFSSLMEIEAAWNINTHMKPEPAHFYV